MTSTQMRHILALWRNAGVPVRPGASAGQLADFEAKYGVSLGDDVREYFGCVDGMDESDADEHGIRFWPIGEASRVDEHLEVDDARLFNGYFVFADYILWSHAYAMKLDAEGIGGNVVVVGGNGPIVVARGFGEFLSVYISDPRRVFP